MLHLLSPTAVGQNRRCSCRHWQPRSLLLPCPREIPSLPRSTPPFNSQALFPQTLVLHFSSLPPPPLLSARARCCAVPSLELASHRFNPSPSFSSNRPTSPATQQLAPSLPLRHAEPPPLPGISARARPLSFGCSVNSTRKP